MLQGKVMDDTFVIVDTFALPVEGTETRVNAAEGAYPYMITYMQNSQVRTRNDSDCNQKAHPDASDAATEFRCRMSCFLSLQGFLSQCTWVKLSAEGWEEGEHCWLVPFSPWLRLLAVWH